MFRRQYILIAVDSYIVFNTVILMCYHFSVTNFTYCWAQPRSMFCFGHKSKLLWVGSLLDMFLTCLNFHPIISSHTLVVIIWFCVTETENCNDFTSDDVVFSNCMAIVSLVNTIICVFVHNENIHEGKTPMELLHSCAKLPVSYVYLYFATCQFTHILLWLWNKHNITGLILGLRSTNKIRPCKVTPSLIGRAQI